MEQEATLKASLSFFFFFFNSSTALCFFYLQCKQKVLLLNYISSNWCICSSSYLFFNACVILNIHPALTITRWNLNLVKDLLGNSSIIRLDLGFKLLVHIQLHWLTAKPILATDKQTSRVWLSVGSSPDGPTTTILVSISFSNSQIKCQPSLKGKNVTYQEHLCTPTEIIHIIITPKNILFLNLIKYSLNDCCITIMRVMTLLVNYKYKQWMWTDKLGRCFDFTNFYQPFFFKTALLSTKNVYSLESLLYTVLN